MSSMSKATSLICPIRKPTWKTELKWEGWQDTLSKVRKQSIKKKNKKEEEKKTSHQLREDTCIFSVGET